MGCADEVGVGSNKPVNVSYNYFTMSELVTF